MKFSFGNFLRTILSWVIIIVPPIISVLGCVTLPDGVTVDCKASWLSPTQAILASSVLGLIVQGIKWWSTKGSGMFGWMFGQVAVLDTSGKIGTAAEVSTTGQPGTVTPRQVTSSAKTEHP